VKMKTNKNEERRNRRILPLKDIRIVSLEQWVAGPFCTQMLADRGAEVIQVEPPEGSSFRHVQLPKEKAGKKMSQAFLEYHRNKKSVTLNLKTDKDRGVFKKLIKTADVFLCNLRPGLLEEWGLGYDDLRRVNPKLIYASITGFGHEGPYAKWPGSDPVIQSMGGLASRLGDPDSPPHLAPLGFSDIIASVHMAYAIVEELFNRERIDLEQYDGQYIDLSLYECTVAFSERELSYYSFNKELQPRGRDNFAVTGFFEAGDGKEVCIIINTQRMWVKFCEVVNREDLLDHPDLITPFHLAKNRDLIFSTAEEWAKGMSVQEVVDKLARAGVPAGFVQSPPEIFECEQLKARGMFIEIDDPVYGRVKLPRTPIPLNKYGDMPCSPPPQLGQHNEEIFEQLAGIELEN